MDEIRGLRLFGEYFQAHQHQYVLIGGVASWITMDEAGEGFRATKDLDIVLIIEVLSPEFAKRFWAFIKAGGYEVRQAGGEKPIFYRFQQPLNEHYPVQIELFCRSPDGMKHADEAQMTPIPTGDGISSLSAILLDDNYYAFLRDGLQRTGLLSYIGADRLIPFKMNAWLNLTERRNAGEHVDGRSINKHRNDVLRLSGQLTESLVVIPDSIRADMQKFLAHLPDEHVDLRSLRMKGSVKNVVERITRSFGL